MIRFDLPDADITIEESFFSSEESDFFFRNLIESVNFNQRKVRVFGKYFDEPRLTAWYGEDDYLYSGNLMEATPWNDYVKQIKDKVEETLNIEFNSCLLNLYRNGNDSVGYHQDNEKKLGLNPIIASVSFGATRKFQIKHISSNRKEDILLRNGSLLVMGGETQSKWKHQIPKEKSVIKPRINLTFRRIL